MLSMSLLVRSICAYQVPPILAVLGQRKYSYRFIPFFLKLCMCLHFVCFDMKIWKCLGYNSQMIELRLLFCFESSVMLNNSFYDSLNIKRQPLLQHVL